MERQQILSKFLCPFTCDSTLPNNGCPFGHRALQESNNLLLLDPSCNCKLKPLPPYCCVSFLAFECSKREYSFQCGAHSSAEILTRCEDGFHMELGEVDDLQLFAQKMAKVLLGSTEISDSKFAGLVAVRNPTGVLKPLQLNSISAGQKRPRHGQIKGDEKDDVVEHFCVICLNQLKNNQTQIGHLDNCLHVFCAKCIHKWQNQGVNEGCPVCRTQITKILVWPKLLQIQEERKQLFDLISGGVPSDERVNRAIHSGTATYFTKPGGEIMRAYLLNPESMKVFLKKPKPSWNCYVMTELAIEGRYSFVTNNQTTENSISRELNNNNTANNAATDNSFHLESLIASIRGDIANTIDQLLDDPLFMTSLI